jgi:hypothetical protein
MKKYLSISIAIIITQFLFSAHEDQEMLDQLKKKQQAIEKIETHKRLEKEAMENLDSAIGRKKEDEKSRRFDMVNKFMDKVGSSGNKWQDQNDSLRGECGDGFCDDLEGENVDSCPEDCDGYIDAPPACFYHTLT